MRPSACILRIAIACTAALAAPACRSWQAEQPVHRESFLKPALTSQSMQLEVFFVRFTPGNEELTDKIWEEIDEQRLPPAVRRELADNGIRVGLVGSELPAPLARLITTPGRPADPLEAAATLERAPTVSRQILQLQSGWRGEVFTSGIWPSISLLTRDDGRVCGQTYPAAQGVLNTRARAEGDRLVMLEITPELEYGEPRQQWISEDGVLRPQPSKPKRVFDHLQFEATLAPGQMLVLTSLPERSGTLGHYLFAEPPDQRQQKLLVVRLAQSRAIDLFSPSVPGESRADDTSGSPE